MAPRLRLSLLAIFLTACVTSPRTPAPFVSPSPTQTPASDWSALAPGFERRELRVQMSDDFEERVIVFRMDPVQHHFRVLYTPAQPEYISAWDRNARLVFNAGFFDEDNVALGLLVTDGQVFGQSYVDFGGMFQVAEGVARVRWLVNEPYQPGEAIEQAVQGFPMLLRPDGTRYADTGDAPDRRTVVAQDAAGNLLLIIVPPETFTLAALADWLATTDLNLTAALNLDGGGSTGYYAGPNDMAASLVRVPAVVAVYEP